LMLSLSEPGLPLRGVRASLHGAVSCAAQTGRLPGSSPDPSPLPIGWGSGFSGRAPGWRRGPFSVDAVVWGVYISATVISATVRLEPAINKALRSGNSWGSSAMRPAPSLSCAAASPHHRRRCW
jgi:hypothetical protein